MPITSETTAKTVRVPDELWARARSAAVLKGETLSAAIRRFLEEYAPEEG